MSRTKPTTWVSPAYQRDYQEWIAKGQFDRLRMRESQSLANATTEQHPALMAASVWTLSTCYCMRGTVALIQEDESGWHDILAGYLAAVYALLFEIKTITLPAWSRGRTFNRSLELAVAYGFSRLFEQAFECAQLSTAIDQHFDRSTHIAEGVAGSKLLTALLESATNISHDELIEDRRACCQSRESYPTRPTEVDPLGVIDLESMLHFPALAAFKYSQRSYEPTPDDLIADAVVAYHEWYR